jgi:hypothetical protein
VRLFLFKLRTTYPYIDPCSKRREIEKNARSVYEINNRIQEIVNESLIEDLPKK